MEIRNDFQARYAAAILNRRFAAGRLEKLIPVFLRSGLEVYPHQIEAAACALYNPYAKGYILADEVGLGKAVEAGLIVAQSHYDGADKIIVIQPKHQTRQWRQLLSERFGLPVKDVEDTDSGEEKGAVRIATYESAAALADKLKETPWDLVIIDEAHRLRKFGQEAGKTAGSLHAAFKNRKKILLTATPIIGNVMDLWSLVTFIDDGAFGSADEFYKRYYKKPENYAELRESLEPFIFRTLRRQVKADVLLPDRLIHTELYELTQPERELYKGLEKYLAKPYKIAFPEMDAYELNLMLYKLFSSSIYAFSKTLAGILARLQKTDSEAAKAEAEEIRQLLTRAADMPVTGKGSAFLMVLHQTLQSLKEKGLPQKAVVFTENLETRDYLLSILENTQYNAIAFKSAEDITIFKTGLKMVDGVANLPLQASKFSPVIEKSKAKKIHVLVATDVASEGFDIQFASAVFNFDLPWALQKAEQRIGRLHRIGQKNDVTVFNFLNNENFADVRLYELAYRRTVTTSDILGASDNLIGVTKSGSQAVADIIAAGRGAAEVQTDFEDLQERFSGFVEANKRDANDTLFNTFDERVAEKTKNYAEFIRARVAETKALLWEFCKFAARGYGIVDEQEKSIRITKSLFKSGNINNASMYLDNPDADSQSLITLTNNNVKQLISIYSPFETAYGNATAALTHRQGERGLIALYTVQFHSAKGSAGENVFVGETHDGRTLSGDECRQIIENAAVTQSKAANKYEDRAAELFAKVLPDLESKVAAGLDDGVAAEIKQIKRRTRVALLRLEDEIKAAELEITRRKTGGPERSDNAFAGNQQAHEIANRLSALKQNEFIEKAKLKKQEADDIAALTAKAKMFIYKNCSFILEYCIRGI